MQEEELPSSQVPVVFSEGIHSRAVQHFLSKALPTDFSVLFMTLHVCPGRRKGEGWRSIHTLCFKHLISSLLGSHAALSNLWREICCSTGQLQAAASGPGAEVPLNDSCQEICHQHQRAQRVSKHLPLSRKSSGRIALMMGKKIKLIWLLY